jgi:hypothetical protein
VADAFSARSSSGVTALAKVSRVLLQQHLESSVADIVDEPAVLAGRERGASQPW